MLCVPGSSVGIATDYGLDGPGSNIIRRLWAGSSVGIATEIRAERSGIESRWGRDFPPVQTGSGHTQSVFSGAKLRPGRASDHTLPSSAWSWKSRAIPVPNLWATPGL